MTKALLVVCLFVFSGMAEVQAARFSNLGSMQKSLGFERYYGISHSLQPLKVAILDKGFNGWEGEIGKSLPSRTVYVPGPVVPPADAKIDHGLRMAELFVDLMTDEMRATQWTPELILYNVFGFSNFKAAVDDLISRKVDLVLYSEVWEYGGNWDGKGFINAQVSRAIQAGVIWVNAAGNFNLTTYTSGIQTGADDWVVLPDQNQALALRCEKNANDKCSAKIVLSWNDFKDDTAVGTNKDLDLVLADDLLNVVEVSALRQTDKGEDKPGWSLYPREIIYAEMKPGLYLIRIKNTSHNFGSADRLRITVDGDSLLMPSHSAGETLLNPADNPGVIVVGASDTERSGVSKQNSKPDLVTPSSVVIEGAGEFRGSSNSASIVAAGLALLKTRDPSLSRERLIKMTRVSYSWNELGPSLRWFGFGFTGPGCFMEARFPNLPSYVGEVLSKGGVLVGTTLGARIMVPFDPLSLAPQLRRIHPTDMVVTTPRGMELYPRSGFPVPRDAVEVFQRPLEAGLCVPPPVSEMDGNRFHLPRP